MPLKSKRARKMEKNTCAKKVNLDNSTSYRKISSYDFVDIQTKKLDKNVLFSLDSLIAMFTVLICSRCKESKIEIKLLGNMGLCEHLHLYCSSCETVIYESWSTKRIDMNNNKSKFYYNILAVKGSLFAGIRYKSLTGVLRHLGLPAFCHRIYDWITKEMSKMSLTIAANMCKKAVSLIMDDIHDIEGSTTDRVVTFDGSWMKRGYVSKYGFAAVIDYYTGYVIDFVIMSKYCQICENILKQGPPKREHDCTRHYSGTAGAMEVHAAELMWRRSVEKNGLRYTIMLSDGDSKAHTAVSKIYDVQKEECINNVHKRLGYHLRKISNIAAKDKVTTGGNGYGQLTGKVIDKLSSYYRNSIHKSTKEEMYQAIWATFDHVRSTDEVPNHELCGKYCDYKKAKDEEMPKHKDLLTIHINAKIAPYVKKVYERMSSDHLLSACLRGGTQNANESLHNVIWSQCSKASFCSYHTLAFSVSKAVSTFNFGMQAYSFEFDGLIGYSLESVTKYALLQDRIRCLDATRMKMKMKKKRKRKNQDSQDNAYAAGCANI